jgi:hypothetical protein
MDRSQSGFGPRSDSRLLPQGRGFGSMLRSHQRRSRPTATAPHVDRFLLSPYAFSLNRPTR